MNLNEVQRTCTDPCGKGPVGSEGSCLGEEDQADNAC